MQENTIHITQNKTRSAQQANSQRDGKEDRSTGNSYKMPLKFLKNKILQRKMFEKTSWGIYPDIKVTLQNSTNEHNRNLCSAQQRKEQTVSRADQDTDGYTHTRVREKTLGEGHYEEERRGRRETHAVQEPQCYLLASMLCKFPEVFQAEAHSHSNLREAARWGQPAPQRRAAQQQEPFPQDAETIRFIHGTQVEAGASILSSPHGSEHPWFTAWPLYIH